jgi:dihydropteroate synthase
MSNDLAPAPACTWAICGRVFDLARPLVMGVVNVTPDSFSDGGRYFSAETALAHGHRLIDEGADLLDIGGESTRPGAADVSEAEELKRVLPAEALRATGVPIWSTRGRVSCARCCCRCRGDRRRACAGGRALDAVKESECGLVLMHMQGSPRTMQREPQYDDVVADVGDFLASRVAAATAAGIDASRIVVDPGFGFGKAVEHNFTLLSRLHDLLQIGRPVLAGLSRKSTLGAVTGRAVDDRLAASVAAAVIAVERGARIVRVHDVAATRDALNVWSATEGRQQNFISGILRSHPAASAVVRCINMSM